MSITFIKAIFTKDSFYKQGQVHQKLIATAEKGKKKVHDVKTLVSRNSMDGLVDSRLNLSIQPAKGKKLHFLFDAKQKKLSCGKKSAGIKNKNYHHTLRKLLAFASLQKENKNRAENMKILWRQSRNTEKSSLTTIDSFKKLHNQLVLKSLNKKRIPNTIFLLIEKSTTIFILCNNTLEIFHP